MSTKEDAIRSLRNLKAEIMAKASQIDGWIEALEAGGEDLSQLPSMSYPTERLQPPKYTRDEIEKLIKEGYQHDWSYAKKILYFLYKHGELTPPQMADKVVEELTSAGNKKELAKIDKEAVKDRIGYQAMKLAQTGEIHTRKATRGNLKIYWLRSDI